MPLGMRGKAAVGMPIGAPGAVEQMSAASPVVKRLMTPGNEIEVRALLSIQSKGGRGSVAASTISCEPVTVVPSRLLEHWVKVMPKIWGRSGGTMLGRVWKWKPPKPAAPVAALQDVIPSMLNPVLRGT